jgi:hypothetical protein
MHYPKVKSIKIYQNKIPWLSVLMNLLKKRDAIGWVFQIPEYYALKGQGSSSQNGEMPRIY